MIGKTIFFGVIFLPVALSMNIQAEAVSVPELTVWVDESSEPVVRNALANYEKMQESYGELFQNLYPEMSLNIEKKSFLSPAQYRKELEEEIQAGGGPDLIYMDEYNKVSGQYLMEQGWLLDLENVTDYGMREGKWEYFPGTLETGQTDGIQYVLPVYGQCPVVFGMEEELIQAGLTGEYDDLATFLEALLEAAGQSDKQIFENTAVLDWIEEYCLPEEKKEREELNSLLAEVRAKSGQEKEFFSPYESLEQGKCLLSGCALESVQKIAQNLGMFEKEQEISFLMIPAWDGETRMTVTHAVAVNANTRYPQEACRFVSIFQETYTTYGGYLRKYFSVSSERTTWQEVLSASIVSTNTMIPKAGREIIKSDKVSRSFQKCVRTGITDAVSANTKELHLAGMKETEKESDKKILTITFEDRGREREDPIYCWLKESAGQHTDENVYIQLAPATMEVYVDIMYKGADIVLGSTKAFHPDNPSAEEAMAKYADLTELLGDTAEHIPVFRTENGEIKGIFYTTGKTERAFMISEHSELKEEALQFCLTALENDQYADAVKAVGEQPLER